MLRKRCFDLGLCHFMDNIDEGVNLSITVLQMVAIANVLLHFLSPNSP